MSAIAGIYHLYKEPIPIEHRDGMMQAFQTFPANRRAVWNKDSIFFGCCSQWITPESVSEVLPFYDYERQLAITADAIVDNRDDLFERLQVYKNDRPMVSDSQLILLAYEKWGEECPKYLIGDFAFMIWDERKRKLFGARDFSGTRTLYYARHDEKFAFSTTVKSLLSLPYITKNLNEEWLAEFIANPGMFESVDTSSTAYQHIHQLSPSHSITIIDEKIQLKRYCTLTEETKLRFKSDNEYVEAFQDVFQTAVNSKLRTFKKKGAHLSGGLDSGSVAAFASRTLKKQKEMLHTFSFVPVDDFEDWTHKSRIANERPYIESTVQYHSNLSPNYVSVSERNPYTEIDEWLDALEMPYKFFENTYWLRGIYEKAAEMGIGVILNGQRGNWTVSWGPSLDYFARLIKRMKWIKFYQEVHAYSSQSGIGRKRIVSVVVNRKFMPITYKKEDLFPIFINRSFARKTGVFEKLQENGIDPAGKMSSNAYKVRQDQFQQLYYWNTTGTYGAKMALRYGTVQRDPTDDLRVIRYCLSIPDEQFVRNGMDRALIRRATEGYLPDNIRLNDETRGVQGADGVHRMIPAWNEFIDELEKMMENPLIQELLDKEVLIAALAKIKHPDASIAFEYEMKILMRSLILYRFLIGRG
ncbi:asparagine synthase-related protein [Cytobacillus purgationiresistens]|uniref:asparagine synthase (glutamine-hydrolyzing) n=1 Tax=Cytobacillus purgationiresistens TaxID=863449 RepID=A0ABU0AI40_9BACI|nr:asparagine synthase-related protein [Cytobacillus purgationiresistens]MDQ0270914.1 asparagine synthase (glutamine-hydrolyzing) [Cytobacillus purgationiresistens]